MATLRDLYNFYLPVYRQDRSKAVEQNHRWLNEKHILRYIGDRDISTIRLTELQILVNEMKGMSETPVRSVVGDLRLVLRHAYIDEYISRDFAPLLQTPQILKGGFRRALTPLEREAVIAVAQTKKKYTAYLFMILCGCRPSEAFAIRKEDIDFEHETVHIRGTKTRQSDRVVPCPRIILTIAEKSLTDEITTSETGLKVTKEAQVRIWHSFKADCHKYLGGAFFRNAPCAPYPFGQDLIPYNLRHEYCTELARRGVDIRITQKLMGHASPEMTLRVYTNLSDDDICTDEIKSIINDLQSCIRRQT